MIITTNDFQALDFNSADIANLYFNNNLVWQKLFETTGAPPLTFTADGNNLVEWSIDGNLIQSGIPTPSIPIYPQECGDLETTGEHAGQYKLPISCGGITTNIYINEPIRKIGDYEDKSKSDNRTTRQIKKIVLTGEEDWEEHNTIDSLFNLTFNGYLFIRNNIVFCSHYKATSNSGARDVQDGCVCFYYGSITESRILYIKDSNYSTVADFKTYLAQQYANGTPVTVWYVLAESTTETITSPAIPTSAGTNTLTVGTTLQPSSMTVKYHK